MQSVLVRNMTKIMLKRTEYPDQPRPPQRSALWLLPATVICDQTITLASRSNNRFRITESPWRIPHDRMAQLALIAVSVSQMS